MRSDLLHVIPQSFWDDATVGRKHHALETVRLRQTDAARTTAATQGTDAIAASTESVPLGPSDWMRRPPAVGAAALAMSIGVARRPIVCA
jgi:hypothetical protein